jgi:hypothetical protein
LSMPMHPKKMRAGHAAAQAATWSSLCRRCSVEQEPLRKCQVERVSELLCRADELSRG